MDEDKLVAIHVRADAKRKGKKGDKKKPRKKKWSEPLEEPPDKRKPNPIRMHDI